MPVSHRARSIKALFAVAATIGVAAVTAYICHSKSAPAPPEPLIPAQKDVQSVDTIEAREPGIGQDVSLGRVLGTNNPAIPPMTMPPVGRPPGEEDTPDLNTPAAAVYSVLTLIDQDATDKLAACFIEETQDTASNLYRRYLGHPIELADVVEDGESALVIWNATVHTEFSLDGTSRSPGETMTLTTRLVRVEDVWKLLRLHEGRKDVSQ